MKKSTYLLFLLFLCQFSFAQQFQLTGKIVSGNGSPLEFAEILILKKDSTAVNSELSDNAGLFSIKAYTGRYIFQIKRFKNILYSRSIDLNSNLNLGEIKVDNIKSIKEVVLNGKKKLIERKVDRLIFNAENSISSTGGDALDVLKVTPGIRVQNDQLYMVGKNNLSLLVNDKLIQFSGTDLTNYLKTIRSDEVASIEVITNPPAKYEAEGNSGLVNIKLKKAKKDSWSASVRSIYEQNTYATGTFGGNFNYQKKNLTIQSNLSYTDGSLKPKETEQIGYPLKNWYSNTITRNYSNLISGKFGIDYKINKKFTVGAQYLGGKSSPDIKQTANSSLLGLDQNLINDLHTDLSNKRKNENHLLNFHSSYLMDSLGKKMTLNADYFNFKKENNQLFSTFINDYENGKQEFLSSNNLGEQKIENYSVKLDMEHPLTFVNLSYGGKLSYTKTANNLTFFNLNTGTPIYDSNQSNIFNYTDNIQSIYFMGNKKFGKDKWEAQAGLRLESTQTDGISLTTGQQTTLSYTKLFPSFYISYTPNDNNTFSLDYGRRISRPRYNLLNPFKTYSSSYSYSVGNPLLKPSYSDNITFNHTFKGVLNSSLYYSLENSGYSMITFIDNNSINQITTPVNYYTSHQFGLNESYTFNKFSFLESYISANVSYSRTISDNPYTERNTEGFGGDISLSNSFIFNKSKTFLGGVDLSYSFPTTFLNTRNKSIFNMDIGLRYLLMQKNLQIGFNVSDIFKTNKQKWTTVNNNINIYRTNYEDVRGFRLSMLYKFGNNKLKVKDSKTGSIEEFTRAKGD